MLMKLGCVIHDAVYRLSIPKPKYLNYIADFSYGLPQVLLNAM